MPNISRRATGQYDVTYTAADYLELQERQIEQLKQKLDELDFTRLPRMPISTQSFVAVSPEYLERLKQERDEARRWAKKYKRCFEIVNKLAEEYLAELYRLQPERKMVFVDYYQELTQDEELA